MLRRFLKTVIDYGICAYLAVILGVMPLFYRDGYSHIGSDKAFFFDSAIKYAGRILLPVVGLYLLIVIFTLRKDLWKEIKRRIYVTDVFAAVYGLSAVISWLCSDYRREALWGADGWYMGLLPQLALVLCYLLVSKLWTPRKWILYLGLAVSGIVFLLGYLNKIGIDPLKMGRIADSFISTIGNINWYCGYQVSVFFAGIGLFWQSEEKWSWRKALLTIYLLLGFGSLLIQGSDSGLLTLSALFLVLFVLSASNSRRFLAFWQEMALLGGACMVTFVVHKLVPAAGMGAAVLLVTGWRPFFVTGVSVLAWIWTDQSVRQGRYPQKKLSAAAKVLTWLTALTVSAAAFILVVNTGFSGTISPLSGNPLFTFNDHWGSNRGATWKAGWMCFMEQNFLHKLVGIGPDAMSLYEYGAGSEQLRLLLQENFGARVLTNAHNEWLTVLIDIGILGAAAFAGMMLTGIKSFLKEGRNVITRSCGLCLLAYTVNNMFSFQQSMNTAAMFAVFGIGGAFLTAERYRSERETFKDEPR